MLKMRVFFCAVIRLLAGRPQRHPAVEHDMPCRNISQLYSRYFSQTEKPFQAPQWSQTFPNNRYFQKK
jgi:hypothetical protein